MCSEYARRCCADLCMRVYVDVCVCLLAYGWSCGIEEALSVVFREVTLTGDRALSRKHGRCWKDFWHTPTALAQTAKEWTKGRCGGNIEKQISQSEVGGRTIEGCLCVLMYVWVTSVIYESNVHCFQSKYVCALMSVDTCGILLEYILSQFYAFHLWMHFHLCALQRWCVHNLPCNTWTCVAPCVAVCMHLWGVHKAECELGLMRSPLGKRSSSHSLLNCPSCGRRWASLYQSP